MISVSGFVGIVWGSVFGRRVVLNYFGRFCWLIVGGGKCCVFRRYWVFIDGDESLVLRYWWVNEFGNLVLWCNILVREYVIRVFGVIEIIYWVGIKGGRLRGGIFFRRSGRVCVI